MSAIMQIAMPFTILFEEPKPVLEINQKVTQLLFGEAFEITEQEGPFVKGICKTDDYKGWIHQDSLTPQTWLPTHFVDALWAPVFPKAGHKNWAMVSLPFMSRIEIEEEKNDGDYAFIPALRGYVHKSHIKPLTDLNKEQDYVDTALRFLQATYQFGGRTYAGLDCSGLIQLALLRSGYKCPRDSGDQEKALGKEINDAPQRGDLVFLEGHVGIMINETNILNATARSMLVQIEPFNDFIKAYQDQGLEITSIKRI
ncbi:MAG: hypothetical protein CMH30_07315 [Micavibrio sp.]|nr:hypothetical protein [Micavibrio sp.]|tara:strand:- start:175 stop:942 length:768 start_codon:yes stop_codon:yes gene_type:complete